GYPEAPNQFKPTFHEDVLSKPYGWRKPRMVFVCSMGDLFHEDVPYEWIYEVFRVMEQCPQHTFQLLTKRPEKMLKAINGVVTGYEIEHRKHIWLGVTAENQQRADERIPILLQIPAAVRFVSVEPMLSKVDLSSWLPHCLDFSYTTDPGRLDWVIVGGETGSGARLMESDWARSLREQCTDSEVPFFFKKHGDAWCCLYGVNPKYRENSELDGQKWEQMPEKETQD
ncbi:MAG: DUF5131 family protein, partial [Proteiniphilum sp.]